MSSRSRPHLVATGRQASAFAEDLKRPEAFDGSARRSSRVAGVTAAIRPRITAPPSGQWHLSHNRAFRHPPTWTAAARQQDEGRSWPLRSPPRRSSRRSACWRQPAGARPSAQPEPTPLPILHRDRRGHPVGRHRPRAGAQRGHPGARRSDPLRGRRGRMPSPAERQNHRGEGPVPDPGPDRQPRPSAVPHPRERGRGAGPGSARSARPRRHHRARHGHRSGRSPGSGPRPPGVAAGLRDAARRRPPLLLQRVPGNPHRPRHHLPAAARDRDAAAGVAPAPVRPRRRPRGHRRRGRGKPGPWGSSFTLSSIRCRSGC